MNPVLKLLDRLANTNWTSSKREGGSGEGGLGIAPSPHPPSKGRRRFIFFLSIPSYRCVTTLDPIHVNKIDLTPMLFLSIPLTRIEVSLHELDDGNPHSMAAGTDSNSESSGCFTLAIPCNHHHQPFLLCGSQSLNFGHNPTLRKSRQFFLI